MANNIRWLDLHKNFSVITMMDAQGNGMGRHEKLPNNGDIIELFLRFDEPVRVTMEATGSWYWLYDLLEENRIEVRLAHPLKAKVIAFARVKNDKIDSRISRHNY